MAASFPGGVAADRTIGRFAPGGVAANQTIGRFAPGSVAANRAHRRPGANPRKLLRKIRLPYEGLSPKSGHRMVEEGMQFPWRWNGGTISLNLEVIWKMSLKNIIRI